MLDARKFRFSAQTGGQTLRPEFFLTSFKESKELWDDPYLPKDSFFSTAVYQPKGFTYQKLDFFDIRDDKGQWTRPRDFVEYEEPLREYRGKLLDLYGKRLQAIDNWAKAQESTGMSCVLACWCPFDRAAQRQLKEWGSYVCHTAVIREVLWNLGYNVTLDQSRDKRMVKLWEME